MSKQLSWIVFTLMTVGLLGVGGVVAHAPELHKDAGPVERLHIVAVEKEATPYNEPASRYEMNMALADNASVTSEPTRSFTFERNYLDYPICISSCGPTYYEDDLQNLGQDFALRAAESVAGNLHFDYEYYRSGLMSSTSSSSTVGYIDVGLTIGEDTYEGQSIRLGPEGGEFNVTMLFHWVPVCEEDENGTEVCQEAPNATDLWSHDALLSLRLRPTSSYSLTNVAWSESLTVNFDTAGGSFLDLAVPAPVVALTAQSIGTEIVSVQHEDLDGDGVVAEPEPVFYAEEGDNSTTYYAPGPALPLILFAAFGLAFLARRRFG